VLGIRAEGRAGPSLVGAENVELVVAVDVVEDAVDALARCLHLEAQSGDLPTCNDDLLGDWFRGFGTRSGVLCSGYAVYGAAGHQYQHGNRENRGAHTVVRSLWSVSLLR
jgi:hypothetical protein